MYLGKINLDPVSGKIFFDEQHRLEQILFEADWAEAKERLGREPTINDLCRTPAHRRADAAREMATRSASTEPGAQRPEPLITFLVDYDTAYGRICQIEGGPIVTPGLVIHEMPGAWFERIVFKPNNRIECSEKSRFFSGGTRRAIEVRDFECSNAYCENPRRRLQIDHIIPYSKGGLTNLGNGRVLCEYCNRMRNWQELGPPGG
jgi:HNH endonuclease